MPIESHLNHYLANHLNAEIVAKNIHNTQDCIDWITWTFLYRRLTYNPNYYNLHEVTGMAINNYLSELIETTIEELHESKCIAVEEDNELEAINSGIIANYYYINIDTVKTFSDRINANSKLKDLLVFLYIIYSSLWPNLRSLKSLTLEMGRKYSSTNYLLSCPTPLPMLSSMSLTLRP